MNKPCQTCKFVIKVWLLLFVVANIHIQAGECPDKYYPKYLKSQQPDICIFLVCAEIDTMSFVKADTTKSNKKEVSLKDRDKVIFSLWKVTLKDIFMVRGAGNIGGVVYYRARALYSEKPVLPYLHKKQVYCLMPTERVVNDTTGRYKIDTLFLWIGYDPKLFKQGIYKRDSYIDRDRDESMNSKIAGIFRKINFDSTALDKKRQELNRIKDSIIQYRYADSLRQHSRDSLNQLKDTR